MNKLLPFIVYPLSIVSIIGAILIVVFAVNNFPKEDNNNSNLINDEITDEISFSIKDNELNISFDSGKTYNSSSMGLSIPNNSNIEYFSISPDKKAACVIIKTITPKWLYYVSIVDDKIESVKQVAIASNCVWSNNSKYIAFNNHTTDVSPVNVNIFFRETLDYATLTSHLSNDSKIRIFKTPYWSLDDEYIYSEFSDYDFNMNLLKSGLSKIFWSKGEVIDQ